MPVINVNLLAGRTIENKRQIVEAMTDAFCSVTESKPEGLIVILQEDETPHTTLIELAARGQLHLQKKRFFGGAFAGMLV